MAKVRKQNGKRKSTVKGGAKGSDRSSARPTKYARGKHPNIVANYFKPGNPGRPKQRHPSFAMQVKRAMRVMDEDGYTVQQKLVATLLSGATAGKQEFIKMLIARVYPETKKHDVNAGIAVAKVSAEELERRIIDMLETGDDGGNDA